MQVIAGSESDEHDLELSHSMAQRVSKTGLYFFDFQSFYWNESWSNLLCAPNIDAIFSLTG